MRNYFVPNLVVLQDQDAVEYVWEGEGCMLEFCNFIFMSTDSLAASPGKQILFAHNSSGFDSVLVLQTCMDYLSEDPRVTFNHGRPIKVCIGNISILDSYAYLLCRLADLPKSFPLEDVAKGMFPHLFNTFENADYEGQLPAKEYFSPDYMKEKEYEEFVTWWNETDAKIKSGELPLWNMKTQLLNYCRDDVRILREAWLKFEAMVNQMTGFIPGIRNCSIASLTFPFLRSTLSKTEDQIQVIPVHNYMPKRNSSKIACEYFRWLDSFYYAGELRYSGKQNSMEACIRVSGRKFFVDTYHKASNTIFEFAGCFYHSCNVCTLLDEKCPINKICNRDLFCQFQQRVGLLQSFGYRVEVMWECKWKRLRETDVDMWE